MKRLKFGCKFPSKWLSFQSQSTERKQLLTLLNKLIELHADREHIEAQDPEQKVTPP